MEALAETLTDARGRLDRVTDRESAEAVIGVLEEAGGQLGFLQVACCAPSRTPLYTETLENLAGVRRLLTRTYRLEH